MLLLCMLIQKTNIMKAKFFLLGSLFTLLLGVVLSSCLSRLPKETTFTTVYKDHLISKELMTVMKDEYSKGNYQIITKNKGLKDSREYWYSLEVLEGYINYLKTEGSKRGYKNMGVKIVMGEYPKDRVIDKRQKPEYKGYQNVFLVPTSSSEFKNRSVKGGNNEEDYVFSVSEDIEDLQGLDFSQLAPPGTGN